MLVPPTSLYYGLPVSPACQSVSQTSMDGSGHKGNTGQLLNSRVPGVLQVITLFITQVSVCQSQSKLQGRGSVEPPSKFKKRGGLTGPQLLEGGDFFQGGAIVT